MIDYDLIIIGSGPAGMNACLYATRSNLSTLVIEKNYPGGKIVKTDKIENYLGTESISGPDLALSMFKHSYSYGGVYEQGNVLDIIDYGVYKEVVLEDKKYKCYSVILALGTSERKIGIPGEEKFYGKGVSYCAVCDGPLYKDKEMVVVGSSSHALEESIYLSQFASKVYVIAKQESVKDEQVLTNKKIEVLCNSEVTSINGNECVESVNIKKDNEIIKVQTSIVFPLLGSSPDSLIAKRLNIVDDKNYIVVNRKQETTIPGIYAAGDCTNGVLKQIVSASADGAIAAMEAYKYIRKQKTYGN